MTRAQWAVIKAAKEWHHWLVIGGVGADYRTYARKFQALKKAVGKMKRRNRI